MKALNATWLGVLILMVGYDHPDSSVSAYHVAPSCSLFRFYNHALSARQQRPGRGNGWFDNQFDEEDDYVNSNFSKDDDNIIDAEIVDASAASTDQNKISNGQSNANNNNPLKGILSIARNTAKAVFNGLSKMLDEDETKATPNSSNKRIGGMGGSLFDSMQKIQSQRDQQRQEQNNQLAKKKRQKEEFNNQIDTIFKDTGLVGGIASTLFKGVYDTMIDNFADASSDIEELQLSAKRCKLYSYT